MSTLAVVTAGLSQPSSTRLLADRLTSATERELRARGLPSAEVHVIDLRDLAHDITDQLLTGGNDQLAAIASVAKLFIADDLLSQQPSSPLSSSDRQALDSMLRSSDDGAAATSTSQPPAPTPTSVMSAMSAIALRVTAGCSCLGGRPSRPAISGIGRKVA